MTACRAWAKRLVVASPDELSGMADTDLSRHVRDCPLCAAEAGRIITANEGLRVAISGPEVDVAELIERARHADVVEKKTRRKRWATVPKLAWSSMAASMAAAAAVAVLFLNTPPLEPLMPSAPPRLLVDAADYNLVVMPTRNPDITVLWFYKETGE